MSKFAWARLRYSLIKVHNIHVKRAIKKATKTPSNPGRPNNYIRLLKACLFEKDDTVPITTAKAFFFWIELGNISEITQPIATTPEKYSISPTSNFPQLVIAYRPPGKKSTYQITIPHYNGNRDPKIPSYKKGNYRGELTCTDNSRLTVYAISEQEALRVISVLRRYITPKWIAGRIPKAVKIRNANFKETRVVPVLADYYPKGKSENNRYIWRKRF